MIDVFGWMRAMSRNQPDVTALTAVAPGGSTASTSLLSKLVDALSSPWLGTIIGIVGVLTAILVYALTRQRTRLAYTYAGQVLLGQTDRILPAGITVFYEGRDIPRLTRSMLVIWNAGEKTIDSADIVATDPLRLVVPDGTVLSATVVKASRDTVQFACRPSEVDSSRVDIAFSYLDSGDGAAIEVLHTGKKRYVEFVGTVRGIPRGLSDFGTMPLKAQLPRNRLNRLLPFLANPVILGTLTLIFGIFAFTIGVIMPALTPDPAADAFRIAFGVIGGLYIILGAAFLYVSRRKYPRRLQID